MDDLHGAFVSAWHAFVAWYVSAPNSDQDQRDASIAIAAIAAVVWTAGFIYRGLPKARTTHRLIRAMHKLQFAYVSPLIVLLAPAPVVRTVAAAFFVYYSLFLIAYVARRTSVPFMGVFRAHLDMIERSEDKSWPVSCIENDLLSTTIIFIFPYLVAVAWVSVYMLFTGYQGLLSGLYGDLGDKADVAPQRRAQDGELASTIRALTEELGKRPSVPQSIYFSIFGSKSNR